MRATYLSRRIAALVFGAILLAAPAAPQDTQQAPAAEVKAQDQGPVQDVKLLRVRAEDTEQIADLLRSFEVFVRTSRQLGLITIAGAREKVARAQEAVREIEKLTMRTPTSAAQDVELTVHFLGIVDEDTTPQAAMLRNVVAELKKTLPFRGYRLLETAILRTRVFEESRIRGVLPETPTESTRATSYSFNCRIDGIEQRQDAQYIRFGFVRVGINVPIPQGEGFNYEDAAIDTGLEMPNGQTVVVGKAGSMGASQGYLLVLTAKVVE